MALILAVSSDWHIYNRQLYSTFDEYGRPSRLTKFEQLGEDFARFSEDVGADYNVISGDIFHSAKCDPQVHFTAGLALRSVSRKTTTIIIGGQHDFDSRVEAISAPNCILTEICQDIPNIRYFVDPAPAIIKGFSVWVQPWNYQHKLPEEGADVLIAHGIVSGSSNYDGYIFKGGFDPKILLQRFKISIIGDIHKGQVIGEQNKILIPGCPTPQDFKDPEITGFWKIELSHETPPVLEFTSIHKVHPDYYDQFITTEDPSDQGSDIRHVRYKKKNSNNGSSHVKQATSTTNVIVDTAVKIIRESKLERGDLVEACLSQALRSLKIESTSTVGHYRIRKVKAKNFYSIREYELDFDDFGHDLVIVGKTGSGKTSIAEAIYWTLTGNVTKKLSVNQIKNSEVDEDIVEGEVTLSDGTTELRVHRARVNGSPLFNLYIDGVLHTKENKGSSQADLEEKLGLSALDIQLLSYFSAEDIVIFSGLTAGSKNNLISKLVNLNELDALREYSSEEFAKINTKIIEKEVQLREWKNTNSGIKSELARISDSSNKDRSSEVKNIKDKIDCLEVDIETESKNLKSLMTKNRETSERLDASRRRFYELQKILTQVQEQKDKLNDRIKKLELQLCLARAGKCYACNQKLQNDDLIEKIAEGLADANSEILDIHPHTQTKLEFDALQIAISAFTQSNIDTSGLIDYSEKCLADLKAVKKDFEVDLKQIPTADFSEVLEYYTNQLADLEPKITKIEDEIKGQIQIRESWNFINKTLLKKNGKLQSTLVENVASMIQNSLDIINQNSSFNVRIDKNLDVYGLFDKRERPYNSLSVGQKRLVDISMMVALSNSFSALHNLQYGILGFVIFDEVLSFLDPGRVDEAKAIIDLCSASKLIVISHDERLSSFFDKKIKVNLIQGISNYELT